MPQAVLWDAISGLLQRVTVLEEVVAQGKLGFEKEKVFLDQIGTRIEQIERQDAANGAGQLASVVAEMQAMKLTWSSAHTVLMQDMRELMARCQDSTPVYVTHQLDRIRRDLDLEVKNLTVVQEALAAQLGSLAIAINVGRVQRSRNSSCAEDSSCPTDFPPAVQEEPSPVKAPGNYFRSQPFSKMALYIKDTEAPSRSQSLDSRGQHSSQYPVSRGQCSPPSIITSNVSPRSGLAPSPSARNSHLAESARWRLFHSATLNCAA